MLCAGDVELNDDILKELRLRRIVKENHSQSVNDICFNRTSPDLGNLMATVGAVQANVYDNEHFGDHLDLVSHYTGTEKQELLSCCWLPSDADALFALGGANGAIQIVSLTQSSVLRVLEGHKNSVVQVFVNESLPRVLFSCAKDEGVRVWDISSGLCVAIFDTKGASAAAASSTRLIIGTNSGDFVLFSLPADLTAGKDISTAHHLAAARGTKITKRVHNAAIDGLAFIDDAHVLSKSVNGRAEYWNVDSEKQVSRFSQKGSAGNNECRFGLSIDRRYVAIGDASGVVTVFHVESGREVSELRHKRSRAAVRACAFGGPQGRNIVYVCADATIWRYDYIDEATLAEWAKKNAAPNAVANAAV